MLGKREVYRQVAQLHVDHINQGFLATLGVGFVALMYRAIDEGAASVLLVDERGGHIAGFVAGASGMGSIYWQMLRHPFRLAVTLAPSVLYPKRVWRIFEILRYSRGTHEQAELPTSELLSIAVAPAYRGQRVAEGLYHRLRDHFREEGVQSFKIIVGEALAPAHKFYLRMGAAAVATIQVHQGAASLVYVQVDSAMELSSGVPQAQPRMR